MAGRRPLLNRTLWVEFLGSNGLSRCPLPTPAALEPAVAAGCKRSLLVAAAGPCVFICFDPAHFMTADGPYRGLCGRAKGRTKLSRGSNAPSTAHMWFAVLQSWLLGTAYSLNRSLEFITYAGGCGFG